MLLRAGHLNHVWSLDLVWDFCGNGRKLRFSYSGRGIHPGISCRVGQHRVQPPAGDRGDGEIDQDVRGTQVPQDGQRSEFIAKALVRWLKGQDVQSRFIDPGSPWQNGRYERFNGTLRNEFLNQEVFHPVDHARALARL